MALAILVYAFATLLLYGQYQKMNSNVASDEKTLSVMKRNLDLITSALNRERIWGLCVLPLSGPVGILISRTLGGYSIMESFQDGRILTQMLIVVLVSVPLITIISEKMNKSAFGSQIKTLEDNIVKMETLQ